MSDPFLGEIRLFGFNFAPRGSAFCNGATLSIAQNSALFALLGTRYGGNGQTTFQLPDLGSRAACSTGQGPGLTTRTIGETFGVQWVTLTSSQAPLHTHGFVLYAQNTAAKRAGSPSSGDALSVPSLATATSFKPGVGADTTFSTSMIQPFDGGGQPHGNQQPYLGMNFCIALQGVFPSSN